MKRSFTIYSALLLTFLFCGQVAFAQQDSTLLHKEVEVIKAYEPIINDAYKINDIPQINRETPEKPTFNYQINSQPVFSTFTIEPVEAAQMSREPKATMGSGLIKGGVGNYKTPYGELFFNTKAGRKSTLSMHFKHLSSDGKIKLLNKDKVEAPQSENVIGLATNHYFRNSTLSISLDFDRQAFRYYGYAGDSISNMLKEYYMPYWNEQQVYSKGNLSVELAKNKGNYDDFNYSTGLGYQLLSSKTGQTSHLINLNGIFDHEFDSFSGNLGVGISYLTTDSILNTVTGNYGKKQQIFLKLTPSILFQGETASLRVGLNSFNMFDDDYDAVFLLTPNIKAEWWPIENMLALFAGADGNLQHNHYSAITSENKYVNPFQDIKNTEYNYILTGGIKGKFSSRFSYRIQADYADISGQHFFVLNQAGMINTMNQTYSLISKENTFDVLYDDLTQLTIGGEIHYTASDEIDFLLKGNFYSYDMANMQEAWQKPTYEASASLNFNPDGPLHFNVDIYAIGEKKALVQTTDFFSSSYFLPSTNEVHTIDPIIDMNFGIEYQYSPNLSFWGHVNNFSFQKYEDWLGYTNQSINLLVGASLSF